MSGPVDVARIGASLGPVLRDHGVVRAGLFGSTARGEAHDGSDLDMLVEFEPGRTLFDLVDLRDAITRLLGRDAHVVTYGSLHPLLREHVLGDQVSIL
jgi:predicted nucleotidyltransferase